MSETNPTIQSDAYVRSFHTVATTDLLTIMPADATTILEETESRRERVADSLRPGAEYFHDNEGQLFTRKEALEALTNELDIDERTANAVLAELAGDTVDPIVHIRNDDERYYGVIEYETFEGAYGYVDYHDLQGKRKRVICAQCVQEATIDTDVAHATAGDPSGRFADHPDADYDALYDAVKRHYANAHNTTPEEVETGASLASGTTVGSNTAWHAGNDGSGSGLDADTVDGDDASSFVSTSGDTINGELEADSVVTDRASIGGSETFEFIEKVTTLENSPTWTSSSDVLSIDLPSGYDSFRLWFDVETSSDTTGSQARLRFNERGDSNGAHDVWDQGGTKTSGANDASLPSITATRNAFSGHLDLQPNSIGASRGGALIRTIPVWRVSSLGDAAVMLDDASISSVHILDELRSSVFELWGVPE